MSENAVIVAAGRTAIGAFGGSLASIPAHSLGATVIKSLLERISLPAEEVDEVILGQVLTTGTGQNPARQAALAAGIPYSVPAMTINKVCGSGLKSVQLAAQAIKCGDADIVIAGGQENMSLAPHFLPKSRKGTKMGEWKLQDAMIIDGLWDAFNDYHMGITAENVAEQYQVSRRQQDDFAAESQQRVAAAMAANKFAAEIIPVEIPQRKGEPVIFDQDEYPKPDVTADSIAKLRPAFKKDGTVTAANASGINDGAAIVIVMSETRAKESGVAILATIKAYASAGVDPAVMGMGPVPASKKCMEKADWSMEDLDLIEANEAFAAQSVGVREALGLDTKKVNVNGGAISLGHPIGASGCRVLVTLLHEMQRCDAHKGLATLCIGGGQGVALAVER